MLCVLLRVGEVRGGRVGLGSLDFLKEIGSGWIRSGRINLYIMLFQISDLVGSI
jgi:hypothetical protein